MILVLELKHKVTGIYNSAFFSHTISHPNHQIISFSSAEPEIMTFSPLQEIPAAPLLTVTESEDET